MTDNQTITTTTTKIPTTTTTKISQNKGRALIKNPNHRRNKSPTEFVNSNFSLDRKIKEACKGLTPSTQWALVELPTDEDKELIADFILNWSNDSEDGMPMSPNTKRSYIDALVALSRYYGYKKSFKQMTREDIVDGYLRSLKKDYSLDPDQKWVNTHNLKGSKYLSFWKWLTQPEIRKEERQTPHHMKGWRAAKRKTKTSVKKEDLWTTEEHQVFLQRCEDPRLACYHAIAKETGGRPGELLELRISDLKIMTSPSTGKKYAEFWIGRSGKMKKGRPVSISDGIPYFNVWVSVHPLRDSPQGAYLFPSRQNNTKYRNKPLTPTSLRLAYHNMIGRQFPKLLDRPDVSLEEKVILRRLINDKPHNPYLRRHEFATEIVHKVPQLSFNQLMGHSRMSRMYDIYVHDLGNEGNRELLISKGIIDRTETLSPAQIEMQPKYCPICHEPNKHSAKFCFKCNFIISKEGYLEAREEEAKTAREAEQTRSELAELKAKQEEASRKQQMDIEQIKAQLEKNAQDQAGILLQALSNLQKQGQNHGTATAQAPKDFVLKKLGILTK